MTIRLTTTIAVLVLTLITVNCAAYYKERSETIAAATEVLLQSRDFDKLYDSLDESAKSLTPKDEFSDRAERLVDFMKQADPDLRFVRSREGGVNPDAISDMYFEYRSLGPNGEQVDVEIWIALRGPDPKLFDVCANPVSNETVNFQHCLTNALRKI